MIRVGFVTAKFAGLVAEYKFTPEQYGKLTDRQLHEVYFHPRDRDGSIQIPEAAAPVEEEKPMTLESSLEGLERLRMLLGPMLPEEEYQRARAEVMARYGGSPQQQDV